MTRKLELYYDFSSTNAYFAAFLSPTLCERLGAELIWRPYHLGHVFRSRDHQVLRDHGPEKLKYLWRDHQRWSKKHDLPFNRPSRFPIKTAPALRGSLAMAAKGLETAYIQAVMRAYWVDDLDIAEPEVLARIAEDLGADGAEFLAATDSDEVRGELRRITETGMKRGAFGAPMFFVGEEMFWGKDRLDFVETALMA